METTNGLPANRQDRCKKFHRLIVTERCPGKANRGRVGPLRSAATASGEICGELPHLWIVNSIRIRPDDLRAFLERQIIGRRDA